VVAAVVDEFAEQRVRDVNAIAEELDEQQREDMTFLERIFKQIDEDGSGELSLEELIQGARKVPEFRSRLRVMDIDQADLEQLFHMLDEDHSGQIAPDEFMGALSRWLNESKTAGRFVKHNVMKTMLMQEELFESTARRFELLEKQMQHVELKQQGAFAELQEVQIHVSAASPNEEAIEASASAVPPSSDEMRLELEVSSAPVSFFESIELTLKSAQENLRTSLLAARLAIQEEALRSALQVAELEQQAPATEISEAARDPRATSALRQLLERPSYEDVGLNETGFLELDESPIMKTSRSTPLMSAEQLSKLPEPSAITRNLRALL